MLDMFYSCFHSMLGRAPWLTIQMQFLIPVQIRDSSIISTLCPRKYIYWQQLFRLQLSTFNNVSGGLTRPSESLFVSVPPGTVATSSTNIKAVTSSHPGRVKTQTCHQDVAALSMVSKCQWWSCLNGEAEYSQQEKLSFTCAGARSYDLIYLYRKKKVLYFTVPIC